MDTHHSFTNKQLLIVDDNQTNILLLKTMLEEYGYKFIFTALSAIDAYSVLNEQKIDLILLDVIMPGIDGITACLTIKNMPKYKHTPIIMVTADTSDDTLKKSFDAGANDFTVKPINFVNLHSRIQNVFIHKEKDELILKQTRSSAMNDIIDTLAHQWRQPLSAINATAMNISISYELDDLTQDALTHHLRDISNYTQELSKTIDDLRNISKVDYKILSTDINKLIKYVINIINVGYENNKISLNLEDTELEKIMIYPNELTRVLLNILINSQDAFIRNKLDKKRIVKITSSQNEKYTQISIKDNAGGIDESCISKVFDPYFSTKHERNGKGLGLHNCKQIIELHQGGKIKINSKNSFTEVIIELLNKHE